MKTTFYKICGFFLVVKLECLTFKTLNPVTVVPDKGCCCCRQLTRDNLVGSRTVRTCNPAHPAGTAPVAGWPGNSVDTSNRAVGRMRRPCTGTVCCWAPPKNDKNGWSYLYVQNIIIHHKMRFYWQKYWRKKNHYNSPTLPIKFIIRNPEKMGLWSNIDVPYKITYTLRYGLAYHIVMAPQKNGLCNVLIINAMVILE